MTLQKRKVLYWTFKLLGIFIACAFPIWAVLERFPLWVEEHGTGHTVSVGVILIAIVLLIIFRKTVFSFITERFNLHHAPPLAIWIGMLVVCYIFIYIGNFMTDMSSVCWMGFIGCAIGTVFTYISERFDTKEVTSDG